MKTNKSKRAVAVVFPAVKSAAARTWRAKSEALVAKQAADAKAARKLAQKAARKAARKAAAKAAAKTARRHTARVASDAVPCSKCGRMNSHGRDCRNAQACRARRAEAKKGGARRAAAR